MNNVRIILDAEGSNIITEDDLRKGKVKKAKLTAITALPEGTEGGKTSVALVGELENGKKVFMETTLRLFQSAAGAFTGRYGDESQGITVQPEGDTLKAGWGSGKSSG